MLYPYFTLTGTANSERSKTMSDPKYDEFLKTFVKCNKSLVSTMILKYRNIRVFFPIPSMWFWTFLLNGEGIIFHKSWLRDKDEPAATELKITQLTSYNTELLWTIADKVCVYHVLVFLFMHLTYFVVFCS